jgi:hypothetical protein
LGGYYEPNKLKPQNAAIRSHFFKFHATTGQQQVQLVSDEALMVAPFVPVFNDEAQPLRLSKCQRQTIFRLLLKLITIRQNQKTNVFTTLPKYWSQLTWTHRVSIFIVQVAD